MDITGRVHSFVHSRDVSLSDDDNGGHTQNNAENAMKMEMVLFHQNAKIAIDYCR